MVVTRVFQHLCKRNKSGFHQGWCNSKGYVNETLHNLQIVLVSDPFTEDSEHLAVPDFCQHSRRIIQAAQPEALSTDAKKNTTHNYLLRAAGEALFVGILV